MVGWFGEESSGLSFPPTEQGGEKWGRGAGLNPFIFTCSRARTSPEAPLTPCIPPCPPRAALAPRARHDRSVSREERTASAEARPPHRGGRVRRGGGRWGFGDGVGGGISLCGVSGAVEAVCAPPPLRSFAPGGDPGVTARRGQGRELKGEGIGRRVPNHKQGARGGAPGPPRGPLRFVPILANHWRYRSPGVK